MTPRPKFPHRLFIDGKGFDGLSIIHEIPLEPSFVLFVVGDPEMGWYEWVIQHGRQLQHSQQSYGSSAFALRDGLIKHWGLPEEMVRGVRDWISIETQTHLPNSTQPARRSS